MNARGTVLLLAALASAPAAAKDLKIAVLEIRAIGTPPAKAELLSEVALTEAAAVGTFDVIGKSDIAAVIGFEKQRQVLGCTEDSSCLAEIGGALGVDYILVGSLGSLGELYRLDLKLVDAKKAKVRARVGVSVEGQEGRLVAAVQKAVRDLLTPVTPGAVPPPVAAEAGQGKDRIRGTTEPGAAPAPTPGGEGGGLSRRGWGAVVGGAGLAFVAGGAVVGLQARAALDDEESATTLAEYDDARSRVKSLSLIADGLFVVGAAGVGVGTWLFITGRPPAPIALDFAPLPGGAMATLSGGF